MSVELLHNHRGGRWTAGAGTGTGTGTTLLDPVLGHELVRVDARGLDLPDGFADPCETDGGAGRERGAGGPGLNVHEG